MLVGIHNISNKFYWRPTNGSKANILALFIACASFLCLGADTALILEGIILPRSDTNF